MGVELRRAALVLVVSALLVAAVGVGTYLFDPELSGVRPTFGSGIDASTGNRVVRDFLADQDAEARAQATGDQSQLEGYLTGNALQDVVQQIATNPLPANTKVNIRPESLSVVQARDPNDPSVVIEVQEDALKTLVTNPQNAAPSDQTVSFHGDFWMRESSGRYLITDRSIQNQPSSPWPGIEVAGLALLWVGAATLLYLRIRSPRASALPASHLAPAAAATHSAVSPPTSILGAEPTTPAQLVVRTFDGLHLLHDGKDWVAALDQRPVTGFVWQRLLIGTIRDRGYRPAREELARQVSPTVDRATRLKRMRNVVQGLRELPAILKDRIIVEPQALSFDLAGVVVDAIELVNAAALAEGRSTLAPSEAVVAQRVFDQTAGTFLPDFEKVEDLATVHHPTCTQLVLDLRQILGDKRVELGVVIADTYLDTGRPGPAIALLEALRRERENRKDLADRLVSAYRATGRDAEAEALAARFR